MGTHHNSPNIHLPKHALLEHKLTRLRDKETPPAVFRKLVHEITQILLIDATRDLPTHPESRHTPLAAFSGATLSQQIGIVPILRAGLGMCESALALLPLARVLHVGFARNEETLEPCFYYDNLPIPPNIDIAIVVDPMVATGGSAIATLSRLKETGIREIRFVGLVGAPEGVDALHSAHTDVPIWLAAIDTHLNECGYIVPGLGDAGDRIMDT